MLRPRLVLLAAALALLLFTPAGRPSGGGESLDQLTAQAEGFNERRGQVSDAEIRELESKFISLLRQDSENQEVAEGLASFYAYRHRSLKTPAPALLELVRTARDPAGLTRIFVDAVGEGRYGLQAEIALAALASRPMDPVLWELAAQVAPASAWTLAFQEAAFRSRATAPSAAGDPTTAALAARWLARLLTHGYGHRALAAYRELPPAVRAAIDDDSAVPDGDFERFGGDRRDLRLELAAAAFLDGDRETAGRLVRAATADPAVRQPPEDGEPDALLVLRRLVERALAAPADDGFDLLTGHLTDFVGESTLVQSLLVARLAVRPLPRRPRRPWRRWSRALPAWAGGP
jgi:hypothetical protein